MPRRSARNADTALFELAVNYEKTSNLLVGEHLKSQMLELLDIAKKNKPDCQICMNSPCDCCIQWLVCGHSFCSSCILKLQKNECPICKWTPP